MSLIMDAADFAARMHAGQTRKGAAGEPYVNHVIDVAARLARAHPEDETLVVAGLLHDVVEDCADWEGGTPGPDDRRAEISRRFGAEVLAVVEEVTDDKRLPAARRKALQVEKVPAKSARAKRLKLADKASNLTAIVESPPASWDGARKAEYLDWAEAVIGGARGVSPALEAEFDAALARAREELTR